MSLRCWAPQCGPRAWLRPVHNVCLIYVTQNRQRPTLHGCCGHLLMGVYPRASKVQQPHLNFSLWSSISLPVIEQSRMIVPLPFRTLLTVKTIFLAQRREVQGISLERAGSRLWLRRRAGSCQWWTGPEGGAVGYGGFPDFGHELKGLAWNAHAGRLGMGWLRPSGLCKPNSHGHEKSDVSRAWSCYNRVGLQKRGQ